MINSKLTLDLHGMCVESALEKADKFIDTACYNSIKDIRIITGNGKIYTKVLALAREHSLVNFVKNDGPLGHLYKGAVELEIHTVEN